MKATKNASAASKLNEPVWTTRDGLEIPYSKISDRHLGNIISYMENRARYYADYAGICDGELARMLSFQASCCREIAQMAMDDAISDLMENGKDPDELYEALLMQWHYYDLVNERDRRREHRMKNI